jgi:hypothetical protein
MNPLHSSVPAERNPETAIGELRRVARAAEDFLANLSSSADRMGKKNSSNLFGVCGGLVGSLSGIGLAHLVGLSLFVATTPLTGLGIVAGILLYRGRKRILIEKRIDENRLAIEEILRRIRELPKNAPERVRDGLWRTYEELNFGYQSQTGRLLSAPQPKYLPPSDDKKLPSH